MAQGSPKTFFVFTPNSIYHIFSKVMDPVDITSHPFFVKLYLTGSLCFSMASMAKRRPKKLQNLFYTIHDMPINKKQPKTKKNLRWSKIGGGAEWANSGGEVSITSL